LRAQFSTTDREPEIITLPHTTSNWAQRTNTNQNMSSHFQSSGRGGAGNIVDSSKTPQLQPEDLQTPTLKTSMVTTGRGGTGNFAVGLDADEKRRRQDVVPYVSPLTLHFSSLFFISRCNTAHSTQHTAHSTQHTAQLT
jgi:hypothetical protein